MRPGYFIFGIFTENTKHFHTFNSSFFSLVFFFTFSLSWHNHLFLLYSKVVQSKWFALNMLKRSQLYKWHSVCHMCIMHHNLENYNNVCIAKKKKNNQRENEYCAVPPKWSVVRFLACIHSMARFFMSKFMLNDICYVYNRHFMLVNLAVFLLFFTHHMYTSLDQLLLSLHCI